MTKSPMVRCAGRIFMPLMSSGRRSFAGVERAGIENEGEAEMMSFISFSRRAVPVVERRRAALGVGDQERQFAGGDDREAAGLIARIDVGMSAMPSRAMS